MFGRRKKVDEEHLDELTRTLGGVALFEGFDYHQLHRVAELAEEVEAEQGAVIIDQGRVGQECYVILEGEAGVYVAGEHVATLGPGSMVGEMALVEHRPRNASVVSASPMKLVAFDTKAFNTLLTEMPDVQRKVMTMLSARLEQNAHLGEDG